MDTILQDISNVICYIDDILVTGGDDQAHLRNLAEVFARLERHGIRMKKGKCHFMRNSVEYLGHRVDATGLHALPDKLEAIQNAPEPTNVQELRSFLGLLNYYGKFIPNLSTMIHPLNCLLQHSARWQWTEDCRKASREMDSHCNIASKISCSHIVQHRTPQLKWHLVLYSREKPANRVGPDASRYWPTCTFETGQTKATSRSARISQGVPKKHAVGGVLQ